MLYDIKKMNLVHIIAGVLIELEIM